MGADFIEPDVVITRDGVLVVRHENEISGSTDVIERAEFADRRATKMIDGIPVTGWFVEDFTLAEMKSLRAREPMPAIRPLNTVADCLYEIPTLQEVIDLARRAGAGIYPETKHPTYFRSIGLPLEEPLVATLAANGYASRRVPAYIQSFEISGLARLRSMTDIRLVQLAGLSGGPFDRAAAGRPRTSRDMLTDAGLREIATYADAIGVHKALVLARGQKADSLRPSGLVGRAHRAGLSVHAWTFRSENAFLPAELRVGDPSSPQFLQALGDAPAEIAAFCAAGVDGLFADAPDTAAAARRAGRSRDPRVPVRAPA